MTQPNPVADAAERLRHWENGTGDRFHEYHRLQFDADTLLLARAYLAEHPPDDGDEITEEWLRSVGFRDGECGMLTRGVIHADLHAFKTFSHVTKLKVYVGKGMATHTTIEDATRGSVRRLAACLGIKLAEPTELKGGAT